jgi:hypothetical protein
MNLARRALGGTTLALTALLASAGTATATAATTDAELIGVVKVDKDNPTVATVHARYRCTGTGHLWVSVKQVADRTADPRLTQEGSSQIAAAMSHSHRNEVTCDGKWQQQKFTVDQVEWGFGQLAKGEAYVQFCLFDDYNTTAPLSENEFLHVRR